MGRKKKIIVKSGNNCLNCRWLKAVEKTGFCPAKKCEIDIENPVFNCDHFRQFEGDYYMLVKAV